MPGKAYTPSGFEPDVHERFQAPAPEVMDAYRKSFESAVVKRWGQRVTYDEIQEYRKRGESHIIGHYAYEMMFDIYAGIEDEFLDGAIDSHLHIYPDYVPRAIDIIELAIECSKAKMRAIVCKDHFFTNVGQAWGAQWVVDEMVRKGELQQACKVLGTHIFAWSHHPDQVNLIRKYPNLGAVFFSTMTAHGGCGPDLPITDDKGRLLPEVKKCIDLCGEYKIPIMTGHKVYAQVLPMVQEAHEVGAHILVTHAGGHTFGGKSTVLAMAGTVEQAKALGRLGAYLEVNGNGCIPNMMWPYVDPNDALDWIKAVGAEYIVANTDFGQPTCPTPVEGFRLFIRAMLHFGLSKEEIKTMIQSNPAKYLFLED